MAKEISIRIKVLTDSIKRGLARAGARFEAFAKKAKASLQKVGAILKTGLKVGFAGIAAGATAMGVALNKAFQFETMQTQFKVLLGSVAEAQKRIEELKKFSAETPFQLGDIGKASRLLGTFSENALGGVKSLRLVGDAAAATGQEISEVAFWVGRANNAIQAGKPWGEAAMRLQEMGILGGKARNSIEELAKAGATNEEVWQALTKELGKFEGGMKELSTTGAGLFSTLKDNWTLAVAEFGNAFLEVSKEGISTLIEKIQELRDSGKLVEWADNIKDAVGRVVDRIRELQKEGKLQEWADNAKAAFVGLMAVVNAVGKAIGLVIAAAQKVVGAVKTINNAGKTGLQLDFEEGLKIAAREENQRKKENQRVANHRETVENTATNNVKNAQLGAVKEVSDAEEKAIAKAEAKKIAAIAKAQAADEKRVARIAQLEKQVNRAQLNIKKQGFEKDLANAQEEQQKAEGVLGGLGFLGSKQRESRLARTVARLQRKQKFGGRLSKREQAILQAGEARQEAQQAAQIAQQNLAPIAQKEEKDLMQDQVNAVNNMQVEIAGMRADVGIELGKLITPAERTKIATEASAVTLAKINANLNANLQLV